MEREDLRAAPAIEPAFFRVGIKRATMRGRWLGAQLRQHRDAAGLTGGQVADRIMRSGATVSRWESGDLLPRPAEVHYLLELYGVRGEERDALVRDAEEAPRSINQEVDVSVALDADHVWLENRAWMVETFQSTVLPGLLQTADYAREVLMAWNPAATSERIERAIAARAARQRRLAGLEPLQLYAILDEAVLHRPIGGPDMMRTQLEYLVYQSTLPNVEIRVLPLAAGAHASLSGAFDIMRFRNEHDLVYLETRGGHMYLDRPAPFADAWRRLEAVALSEEKSIAMICRLGDLMTRHVLSTPDPPDLSEVNWRKSRHSSNEQGCVETAFLADGRVAVRDSKDRDGPALIYTPREWDAFIKGSKDGEFDLPRAQAAAAQSQGLDSGFA